MTVHIQQDVVRFDVSVTQKHIQNSTNRERGVDTLGSNCLFKCFNKHFFTVQLYYESRLPYCFLFQNRQGGVIKMGGYFQTFEQLSGRRERSKVLS